MTYAYFKFEGAYEGTWPADHSVQAGTIVRQPTNDLTPLPLTAWNDETHEWAMGIWRPTSDPAAVLVQGGDE